MTSLAELRKNYSLGSLDVADVDRDPFRQFDTWFQQAVDAKLPEPNTMTLATVDSRGRPSARIVLIKGVDERGFVFFTNYESRKGRELAANSLREPAVLLDRTRTPGAHRGPHCQNQRGRKRHVLRVASARFAHRCVGIESESGN